MFIGIKGGSDLRPLGPSRRRRRNEWMAGGDGTNLAGVLIGYMCLNLLIPPVA